MAKFEIKHDFGTNMATFIIDGNPRFSSTSVSEVLEKAKWEYSIEQDALIKLEQDYMADRTEQAMERRKERTMKALADR